MMADDRISGSHIEAAQRSLKVLGYKVFEDGILGPATRRAVEESQKKYGLKPSGKVDDATLNMLRSEAAKALDEATMPSPSPEKPESISVRPVVLSDKAIETLAEDQLGFAPAVQAVVRFLLSQQTKPPLAIAIHASWGTGKTSFMNLIDNHIKEEANRIGARVGTVWFNPWQYSNTEQVWGAFVATVVKCVQNHLGFTNAVSFRAQRFWMKLRNNLTVPLAVHFFFAAVVAVLAFTLLLTGAVDELAAELAAKNGILKPLFAAIKGAPIAPVLEPLLKFAIAALALLYVYVTLGKKLGLNLLDYVQRTDFKDKIGTLAQFDAEMARLNQCTPDSLKLIVFIDDLDRCNPVVLGEMVEALQLTSVSRRCIFVIGMDLNIVAQTIESFLGELARAVGGGEKYIEHGGGYKFLEKLLQARVSIPSYGRDEMTRLAEQSFESVSEEKQSLAMEALGVTVTGLKELAWSMRRTLGLVREEAPADSDEVRVAVERYGSQHFSNPRRLKRFINSFRLHAYLLGTQHRPISVDTLARFLVLAEKWPGMLAYLLEREANFRCWCEEGKLGEGGTLVEGEILSEHERRVKLEQIIDRNEATHGALLRLVRDQPMLQFDELKFLSDWYGFRHHVSGLSSTSGD